MENANSIFKTVNQGMSKDAVVSTAMQLWKTYSETYRTLPTRYHQLLKKKIELKLYPLHKVPNEALKSYPKIKFLEFEDVKNAEDYLRKLSVYEVGKVIQSIEDMHDNYAYITIKNRVCEFQYQLNTKHNKCRYGVNPDAISNGKGSRSRNKATRE